MKNRAGDKVKLTKKDGESIEGILMPRPEMLEKGFTVIKLDNGYNMGIEDKKIKSIEVIEQYKPKEKEKKELKFDERLPTVAILSTGGTISSKIDYRTGGVYADYDASDFVAMCPELESIANLKAKKIMSVMTEDFTIDDWINMSKILVEELNSKVDAVVLTMGTDTLHITAAALSFLLKDLNKPVIITASQRSIDRGSSDAFMNLICSVKAAAKIDAAEVMTCLHGTTNDDYCLLIRGTKVRKMHTSRRDAFRPVNDLPIAKIPFDGKIEILNDYKKKFEGKVGVYDRFEEKTAMIQVYPGMDPEVIDFYVNKGYKGIVLAATALGHVPVNGKGSLVENIRNAIEKGVIIIIATQTLYGRVHPLVYTNLRKLSLDLGCTFAEDIMPEVAYVKLGWALGQTKEAKKVKELMLQNIAGEITSRTLPSSFLY